MWCAYNKDDPIKKRICSNKEESSDSLTWVFLWRSPVVPPFPSMMACQTLSIFDKQIELGRYIHIRPTRHQNLSQNSTAYLIVFEKRTKNHIIGLTCIGSDTELFQLLCFQSRLKLRFVYPLVSTNINTQERKSVTNKSKCPGVKWTQHVT